MIPPAINLLRKRLETDTGPEGDLYRTLGKAIHDDLGAKSWTVEADADALLTDNLTPYLKLLGYQYRAEPLPEGRIRVIVYL